MRVVLRDHPSRSDDSSLNVLVVCYLALIIGGIALVGIPAETAETSPHISRASVTQFVPATNTDYHVR